MVISWRKAWLCPSKGVIVSVIISRERELAFLELGGETATNIGLNSIRAW